MFSLIITIVAIALVAALALATLYYGGTAFQKSTVSARATRVITHGQQIQGAQDMFRADFGRWPTQEELLGDNDRGFIYLRSWPEFAQAPSTQGLTAQAWAEQTPSPWVIPDPVQPTAVLADTVSEEVCAAINEKTRGDDGISKMISTAYATQCFSPEDGKFTVVITKASFDEILAIVDPNTGLSWTVTELPLPVQDTTDTTWAKPPDEPSVRPDQVDPPPAPPSAPASDPGPGRLAFANTTIGENSPQWSFGTLSAAPGPVSRTATVVNTGSEPIPIDAGFNLSNEGNYPSMQGNTTSYDPHIYMSVTDSCGSVVPARGNCTITFTIAEPEIFTNGDFRQYVSIWDRRASRPVDAPDELSSFASWKVTGNPLAALTASTPSFTFVEDTSLDRAARTAMVTITNSGGSEVYIDDYTSTFAGGESVPGGDSIEVQGVIRSDRTTYAFPTPGTFNGVPLGIIRVIHPLTGLAFELPVTANVVVTPAPTPPSGGTGGTGGTGGSGGAIVVASTTSQVALTYANQVAQLGDPNVVKTQGGYSYCSISQRTDSGAAFAYDMVCGY